MEGDAVGEGITVEMTWELRGNAKTEAGTFKAEKMASMKEGPEARTSWTALSSRKDRIAIT